MTRKISSLSPEDNLEEVRRIFEQHGFHHAPVVAHGKLVGIVSYTDYLRVIRDFFSHSEGDVSNQKMLHTMLVKDIMTPNPICLRADDTVGDALQIFRTNHFHALPVTDTDLKLLGILTTYDVMKAFEDVIAPEHSYTEK